MSKKLQKELHMQRVSKHEAAELAELADMVRLVNPPGLSPAARQRVANRLPVDVDHDQSKKNYAFRWAMAGLAGSFAVLFILMTSLVQSALPDPTVYHAKDGETKTKKESQSSLKTPSLQSQDIQQLETETKIKQEPKKPESNSKPGNDSGRDRDRRYWWDRYDRHFDSDKYRSSSRDSDKRWWD